MGEIMRRYFEYGALSASLVTFLYLLIAFFTDIVINLQAVGICIVSGLLTGLFISLILYRLSPGEAILEGEEDNYIKDSY